MNFPADSQVGALLHYIAYVNKRGVNKLAYQNGYHVPADSQEDRFSFLNKFCKENPDVFFYEIAEIHPDKDMIQELIHHKVTSRGVSEEEDEFDNFVESIASSVGELGKGITGAIGKRGENKAAIERAKQESKAARYAAVAKSKSDAETQKKWIIIGSVVFLVAIVATVVVLRIKKII